MFLMKLSVEVSLSRLSRMSIKGFDASKLTHVDPGGRGAGLFTIKERVKLVGGNCNVDSHPGQGTRVTVNVPLLRGSLDEKDKGSNS